MYTSRCTSSSEQPPNSATTDNVTKIWFFFFIINVIPLSCLLFSITGNAYFIKTRYFKKQNDNTVLSSTIRREEN
nr:MAG TPA: hypothetical protein [Caudoviricetes sp.]